MPRVQDLKIKIFADGADIKGIVEMPKNPLIGGIYNQSDINAQGRRDRLRVFCAKPA